MMFGLNVKAINIEIEALINKSNMKNINKILKDMHIKLPDGYIEYDKPPYCDSCFKKVIIGKRSHTIYGEKQNFEIYFQYNSIDEKRSIIIALENPYRKSLYYFDNLFHQTNIDLNIVKTDIDIDFFPKKNETTENLFSFIWDNINLKGGLDKYKLDNKEIFIAGDGKYFCNAMISKIIFDKKGKRVSFKLAPLVYGGKKIKKSVLYSDEYFKDLVRQIVGFDDKQFNNEFLNSLESQKRILLH